MSRKIKDAKDLATNELVYFRGHAKATYMSDGSSVEDAILKKQGNILKFTNLAALTWVDDTTYADYPYRCDLACSGVVADYYAEVVFGVTEATSGDYAPICEAKTDAVSVWSKKNDSIVIPTIIITKL